MPDLSKYPARVSRHVAMQLLSIDDDRVFRKVVDANPDLAHTIAGERKAKYLLATIARLLEPNEITAAVTDRRYMETRCATGTGGGEVRGQKAEAGGRKKPPRTP